MKTTFTTTALLLTAGFPGSLLAETAGLDLPAALSSGTTFGVFVAVLTLLTAFADYGRPAASPLTHSAASAAAPAAAPMRATEERRLAA